MGLGGCGGGATTTTRSERSPSTGAATTRTTASATPPGTAGGRLAIAPSVAAPSSEIAFTLHPPAVPGRHGGDEISYALTVAGPGGPRCAVVTGRAIVTRLVLGPAELGERWCAGSYTARVQELERAACRPGQVCPQFVRLVGTVATARFRVRGR